MVLVFVVVAFVVFVFVVVAFVVVAFVVVVGIAVVELLLLDDLEVVVATPTPPDAAVPVARLAVDVIDVLFDGVRYQFFAGSFRHSPTVTPLHPFALICE